MSKMSFAEILECLPHRYPFLLIDRVIEFELGKTLVAIKNVSVNEPFFAGHFPGRPIMPGVLMLEALAQAGTILAFKTLKELEQDGALNNSLFFFAGIDNARFNRVVEPGDQLRLEVTLTKMRRSVLCVDGIASVDGELACSATLMSARKDVNS